MCLSVRVIEDKDKQIYFVLLVIYGTKRVFYSFCQLLSIAPNIKRPGNLHTAVQDNMIGG